MIVIEGDKGILMKNGYEYRWNPCYTPVVGETVVAYPTEIGDYVALPISTPIVGDVVDPGTGAASRIGAATFSQWWGDSQFRDGETKWFADGAYFTEGTYRLAAAGWYAYQNTYTSYFCGTPAEALAAGIEVPYHSCPKYIVCCWGPSIVLESQSGGSSSTGLGSICTTRNLSELYGVGTFTIPDMTKIGIKISDSDYTDNHGDATFTITGPL